MPKLRSEKFINSCSSIWTVVQKNGRNTENIYAMPSERGSCERDSKKAQ